MTKSLEPTGLILLVTACGGVLRYVLQYSGLGDVIGNFTYVSGLRDGSSCRRGYCLFAF